MKEATEDAAVAKLNSIENPVPKSLVRDDQTHLRRGLIRYLCEQTEGVLNYRGASLCGVSFAAEQLAINSVRNEFGDRVNIGYDSAEYNKKIFNLAIKNLPEGCTIVHGDFDHIFNREREYKGCGIGRILPKEVNDICRCIYDEIWADYCIPGTKEMAKLAADCITHNMKRGIYWLTLNCGCRESGGVGYKLHKLKMICGSKSNDPAEIMMDLIRHYLKVRHGWKGSLRLVYNVRYNGGANGSSIMSTIGLAVNLPASLLTPIIANRQEATQKRKLQLNNVVYTLRHEGVDALFTNGRGLYKRKDKKGKPAGMDKAEVLLSRKIYKRWAKMTTLTTKEISAKISAELGLNRHSVGSKLAWLSPNLAKGIKDPIRKQLVDQALALRAKRMGSLKKYVATCHKILKAA